MMLKRGEITVEKTVNLIIGIGGAVILFILFVALFNMVSNNFQARQAQATLDDIVYSISKLSPDETQTVLLESPKNWLVFSRGKEICFCRSSSDMFFSSPLEDPYLTNKSFELCKAQGICESLEKDVQIGTKCAISTGVAFNCFQLTKVPYSLTLDMQNSYVKLFESSSASSTNSVYGLQNPSCDFFTGSLYYIPSVSMENGYYLLENITPSFTNCNMDLLKDSIVRFEILCSEDSSSSASSTNKFSNEFGYYPASYTYNSNIPNCKLTNLGKENASFSCYLDDSLFGDSLVQRTCKLQISVDWATVDCSSSYLEGTTRCPSKTWVGLVLNKQVSDEKLSCSIDKVTFLSNEQEGNYELSYFNFSFNSNCTASKLKDYLKSLDSSGKITYFSGGEEITTFDYNQIVSTNEIKQDTSTNSYEVLVKFNFAHVKPSMGDSVEFSYPSGLREVPVRPSS